MNIKAVTYLRVSGASQIEGDDFPRQREACNAYANANGMTIVDEFRDEAVSGTTDADAREGFAAMVERIAGNGVRVVLVERADRLARDLIVSETLLGTLSRLGMRVVEAASGIELSDSSDPSRILIRQVLGSVAEFNKRELVGKLAKARARIRKAAGRCEGRKPFGARDGEAETVKRIRELRRESLRQVAARLDEEGRATRSGKPWSAEAVRGILTRVDAEAKAAKPKRVRRKAANA
jgi:DNA invertase Pin-like site-specific DNA recombinase